MEVHCNIRTEEACNQNNRAYSEGIGENGDWHAGEEDCEFLDEATFHEISEQSSQSE